MKVLLTGATGFLGRHAHRALLDKGIEVVAISRNPPSPRVSTGWRQLDLFDRSAVRTLLAAERPTHLAHMAWRPVHGDVASAADNLDWVKTSLDLAAAFVEVGGRRFVGLGSCFEYDWSGGLCAEETPLVPSTYYGACKNALRAALFGLMREAGVEFAWPRVFFAYGPGENETRFVAYLVRTLLAGRPAEITSGEQVRDYVYAGDVADAVVRLLNGDQQGEFNIASGLPVRLLDIAAEVARQVGRPDLLRVGARPPKAYEPPVIVATIDRAQRLLGWRAKTSLDQGISDTIAWARNGVAAGT